LPLSLPLPKEYSLTSGGYEDLLINLSTLFMETQENHIAAAEKKVLPVLDIVLISVIPPIQKGAIWKQIERCFPSTGLLSLAAYVREKGFKPMLIDASLENLNYEDITERLELIKLQNKVRYFGISTSTAAYYTAQKLIIFCKKNFPESGIIIGGAHASALPDAVLSENDIDFLVRGEGELPLHEILEDRKPETINGISYKQKGKIIHNPDRQRIIDLDTLPMPAYDLVPIKKSKPFVGQFVGLHKPLPSTLIFAGRGCIGKCSFCAKYFAPGVSYKSPQKILDEILHLKHTYGFKHFVFYDDTFSSNPKLTEALCDLLITAGKPVSWTCSSRADCVDEVLLKKMKKAGCIQILYGIESFNDGVLKNIGKRTDANKNKDAIRLTKKAGMVVRVAVMVGNPGDTIEILNHNIKVLQKLQPDMIQVTISTPLPGSLLFEENKKKDMLLTTDWDKYNGEYAVIKHDTLNEKELKKYYLKTYLFFYFHYKYLFRKAFSLSTYKQLRVFLSGFLAFIPVFFSFSRNNK